MTSRSPLRTQSSQNYQDSRATRVAYVNSEVSSRDPTTIFHSPFKEGKRNYSFNNPTFTSSSIFYADCGKNIELKSSQAQSKSPIRYIKDISNEEKVLTDARQNFQKDPFNSLLAHSLVSGSENLRQNERSITPTKSNRKETSFKEDPKPHLTWSGQQKPKRLKKQFDNSIPYIKDHFQIGLEIQSEKKRNPKKYLNTLSDTKGTGIFYDLEENKNQQQPNRNLYSNSKSQANLSPLILETPKQAQQKKFQDTPQNQINLEEKNSLVNSAVNERNRTTTPSRRIPQNEEQNLINTFETPKIDKYCEGCYNLELSKEKKDKQKKDILSRQRDEEEVNKWMQQDNKQSKEINMLRSSSQKNNYAAYVREKQEREDKERKDKIMQSIRYNEEENQRREEENMKELEYLKQAKLDKIRQYSQQLQEQINVREQARLRQLEIDTSKNLYLKRIIQDKQDWVENQKMQLKREAEDLKNVLQSQKQQQDQEKSRKRQEEKEYYQQINNQIDEQKLQEKQNLQELKQMRKQEFQAFQEYKQKYKNETQENKMQEQNQQREFFKEIDEENYIEALNKQAYKNSTFKSLSSVLQQQIQEKQETEKRKREIFRDTSTSLLMSKEKTPISPCNGCSRQVPINKLSSKKQN